MANVCGTRVHDGVDAAATHHHATTSTKPPTDRLSFSRRMRENYRLPVKTQMKPSFSSAARLGEEEHQEEEEEEEEEDE